VIVYPTQTPPIDLFWSKTSLLFDDQALMLAPVIRDFVEHDEPTSYELAVGCSLKDVEDVDRFILLISLVTSRLNENTIGY